MERLEARGEKIDVLVNNVGIQKRDQIITREGLETSFATNILSHYLFTRELLARGMLADDATVIETSSGGMYNHPLVVKDLNLTGDGYVGVRAYGLSKRAQVVLTQYWREKFAGGARRFYVMHPGWVDTAAVGRSMPRFRETLKSVLRSDPQGADTIVYLAALRPRQDHDEAIWFDRKERGAHIFPRTRETKDSPQTLVALLESYADRPPGGW
ncbi:SDR family oxidoreductase [Ramlibacter terrae]|uniref:SDR family oxidoreductase n=1 Tax=Ramlibacter terrae TaxID=2732511 RepID=A0ABX6P689_9BURK|nr:SDR family oxidoreductase [Ramlibacter terrae]